MKASDAVERVLTAMFPADADRDRAVAILGRYGTQPHHRETDRVRLAILKMASDSLQKLEVWTRQANADYRDVLAAAEYPQQSRNPAALKDRDPEEYARINRADRAQYEEWLGRYLGQ